MRANMSVPIVKIIQKENPKKNTLHLLSSAKKQKKKKIQLIVQIHTEPSPL